MSSADPLSTGVDIVVTNGISRIAIVALTGSDTVGNITITGTSVDRNTGLETPADTEVLTIAGVSIDDSDTNPIEGSVIRHDFTNGYVTSKWFKGSVTISTTDVNFSDVDTYTLTYDQFNDNPSIRINAFDFTGLSDNVNAAFYGYLYTVIVIGNTFSINRIASLELNASDVTTGKYYKLRKANLATTIDGLMDGIIVSLNFFRDANQDWLDISIAVQADVQGTTI